ncbi:MAG: efflux RND transporter periplasmic adaptor subunit [Litorilituus sp.]|nr:efflux RND transporter periplasmic adaptor subunit [Litorilituus sp.]
MSKQLSSNQKMLITGLTLTLVISVVVNLLLFFTSSSQIGKMQESSENKPLYWVAPMDANYRRDHPGKSPMGMDLVPVYDEGTSVVNEGEGTIRVSADVINNLGVRTVLAQYKLLHNNINTVGYVTYDEDKLVHIHPRVDGWIDKLYVKTIGSVVKKGQALYDIYSPELVNAQEEFLLALERNNKRLISAAENRLIALQIPRSAISVLKASRKVQQSITFFAPQNGVVENLKIREGFFVQPGATLMSIGDLSKVWIEAEVFERQAAQVQIGTKVTMRLDYLPGKIFNGQVDFIYPTLDAVTRTVKVRLRFDNQSGDFKPNMFAQVTIHTNDDKSTLIIPKEALIRTGTQDRVVLALGKGHFKSVAVLVGRFDTTSVEILSGLTEGEAVVSSAQFLLDSESSKSSDFKRMHHDDSEEHQSDEEVMSATTTGVINSLMANQRMANISRAGIEKWQRPPATMDFLFDESLNLNTIKSADNILFTFEIRGDDFVIVAFDLQPKEQGQSL